MTNKKQKVLSMLLAIVMFLSCFAMYPLQKVNAEEQLQVGIDFNKKAVKPGETIKLTFTLPNYADIQAEIGGMIIKMYNTDDLTIQNDSVIKLFNDPSVVISKLNTHLVFAYVPLQHASIPKDVTQLFSVEVKANAAITEDKIASMPLHFEILTPDGESILEEDTTTDIKIQASASLSVDTVPSKTTFVEGDTFSAAGGMLTYEDATSVEKVPMTNAAVTLSGYNMNTVGKQTVTATYKGLSTSYQIEVLQKSVSSISIKKAPTPAINGKTSPTFVQDQDFQTMGDGTLTVLYDNGTSADVKITDNMISGYDLSTVGTKNFTVSYGGKTTSFSQAVIAKAITGISVNPLPNKLQYKVNLDTVLNTTGGKLNINYNNGKSVISDLTTAMCSKPDFSKVGKQTVTATSTEAPGYSDAFEIIVNDRELQSIAVSSNPTTKFSQGSTFNINGGKIKLQYDNNTSEIIDMNTAMCSGYNMNALGEQKVTVTYNGKTTSYNITVVEKQVTGVTLTKQPSVKPAVTGVAQTNYIQDQDFGILPDGLVEVSYDNGTKENMTITTNMLSGYNMAQVGNQTVTVKVNANSDKVVTYPITVEAKKVNSIRVNPLPNKLDYKIDLDTEFTTSGGVVNVNYNNGKTETTPLTTEMCTKPDLTTLGEKIIEVNYLGHKDAFKIRVNDKILIGINIKENPITEFIQGQDFSVDGGKIELVYDNKKNEVIEMTTGMCSPVNMNTVGKQTVTVTYQNFKQTYDINIKAKSVTELQMVTDPNKVDYIEGNKLDTTGATMRVSYDNGKDEVIAVTADMCTVDMNKIGNDQSVKVSYGGKTTSFKINIEKKSMTGISIAQTPKNQYLEKDPLDLSKGKIKVDYNNETSDTILMTASGVTVTGYNANTVGKQTLTVSYEYDKIMKDVKFDVEVISREKVDAVIAEINKIDLKKLQETDRKAVYDAKAHYDALGTQVEKDGVTNYDTLKSAIDKFEAPFHSVSKFSGMEIVADGPSNSLPLNTELQGKLVELTDALKNSIKATFENNPEILASFDLSLVYPVNGEMKQATIKEGSLVTYAVKMDNSVVKDRNLTVVFVKSNGEVVKINAQYANGYAIFETAEQGTFSIVATNVPTPAPTPNNPSTTTVSSVITNPGTGMAVQNFAIVYVIAGALLLVGVIVVIQKRKRSH